METKILLLLTLLPYSIIVSQSFYYMISLRNVLEHMDAEEYIIFRHLTDKNFRTKFKWVVYAAMISNLLLVIACIVYFSAFLLICAVLSMLGLLADTWLTVKGNIPVNTIVNSWTKAEYPANWAGYRARWLKVFSRRQLANTSGFISLLTAAVFS